LTTNPVDERQDFRDFAMARAGQLFRIAYLMSGDWHEAEDLVQTTLTKLFVAWGRVQRRGSVDTYARRVLVNTYLSQRRLRRSRELPVADIGDAGAPSVVDAALRMTLLAALRELPARSRAVVILRHIDDQSVDSVAQLLGTTPAAVKSLNARGLSRLRELLGADQSLFFS
jgi:RNA polymerase sigma-70 factor (sigma-E family)